MKNALTTYRPGLLGRSVIDDVFDSFFVDFPRHLKQTTQGYPVADIFRDDNGNTVLEFALAGFKKEELSIDIRPDKRSITVAANSNVDEGDNSRRIARRSFVKTYVNYDNNLDLVNTNASYADGLLTITVPQLVEARPIQIEIA
tara:strand:+ start:52 stop:483 length:432 start_codon:yes stop_codon:yes gene_type:complete